MYVRDYDVLAVGIFYKQVLSVRSVVNALLS